MTLPNDTPAPTKPQMAGCQQEPCSASFYGPVRKMFGIYYIIGRDLEGWWITDKKGYKTMMNFALTKVTTPDGGIAHQIILGRWMLMLVSPQNVEAIHGEKGATK